MKLIECLEAAKPEDLEAVRAECAKLEKKLAALRQVEKLLDVQLNGPKEKKKRAPKAPGTNGAPVKTTLDLIRDYLSHSGPKSVKALAADLNVSAQTIYNNASHEWFDRVQPKNAGDPILMRLSEKGIKAAFHAKNGA